VRKSHSRIQRYLWTQLTFVTMGRFDLDGRFSLILTTMAIQTQHAKLPPSCHQHNTHRKRERMVKVTSLLLLFASVTEAFVSRPFFVGRTSASVSSRTSDGAPPPLSMLPPVPELVDTVNHHNNALSTLLLSLDTTTTTAPPETAGISYSKASYYTVLGLYLMSFPGIWSQIKRSTKAKVKRKTYVSPGANNNEKGMSLRQQAGEIMACELFSMMVVGG